MYIPAAFAEPDPEVMLAFVEAHPLGALVTAAPAAAGRTGLFATHVPLVVDRTRGPHGVLQGHVARANPHASVTPGDGPAVEALVIFTGPDAYVHPGWYPSKQQHGRVVPTWNYVAVHASGPLRLVDDPAFLLRHLASVTSRHEAAQPHPWTLADAPPGYIERMMRDIVGVEIDIARLEGKWKMSQNRPAADIAGVVEGLAAAPTATAPAVASLVDARRPPSKR
jgi:transcriptional regulator